MYKFKMNSRSANYGINAFDKFDVITMQQFLKTASGYGREEEIEKYITCTICDNPMILSPDRVGVQKLFRSFGTRGLYATCSDECANMFILRNI